MTNDALFALRKYLHKYASNVNWSDEICLKIYLILPKNIKLEGLQWGFNDVLVGEQIIEFITRNRKTILSLLEP